MALAVVLALAGGLSLLLGGGPVPSGVASPTTPTEQDGFPVDVLGMPVVTIADALTLIDAGRVDGRALAVGGWWIQPMMASCPAPGRWMAELEAYCGGNIFSSRGFSASTCTQFADRTECHSNQPPAGAAVMAPIIVNETSGLAAMGGAANAPRWRPSGAPVVVIGHTGDPRLWHCPAETREECRRQFVIDRVAWVAGEAVDLAPNEQRIPTAMTLPEAAAVPGTTDALAALPVMASTAPTIDPRLHFVGDSVLWIVRGLSPTGGAAGDPTRDVVVAVRDDATVEVLQEMSLKLAADPAPALLLIQATQVGECCAGNVFPFYRVELPDGTGVQEMSVSGWSGGGEGNLTRYGAGAPVVLEPGNYVIRVWRSWFEDDGSSGVPRDECEAEVSLVESQELRVQAAFPAGACEFVDPTFVGVFEG